MPANELIELLKRNISVSYQTFEKALQAARTVSKRYELEIFIIIDGDVFTISSSNNKDETYTSEEVGWVLDRICGVKDEADIHSEKSPSDKPLLSAEELEEQELRNAADWSEAFDDLDADDWEHHYDRPNI
jgi:hypothetical protein